MSQGTYLPIDPTQTSGSQLAQYLNDFEAAVTSGFIGTSRPSGLNPGGMWVDSSLATSNNIWIVKIWNGTIDIVLFKINLTTGTASVQGSDTSFQVTKVSADTSGALLQLYKSRIATNGQVVSGDTIGEIQFNGHSDTAGATPLVARIRVIATDTETSSANGAYMVIECATAGSTALVEALRAMNGNISIGVSAAEDTLHVRGTGIRSEKVSDDTNAARLVMKKKRIAGTGAAQANDNLGIVETRTIDSSGVESLVAHILTSATENHTTTNKGASLLIRTIKTGAAVLSDTLTVGDTLTSTVPFVAPSSAIAGAQTVGGNQTVAGTLGVTGDLTGGGLGSFQSLALGIQSIATAATITALSALKAIVNFTGSTATTLNGIDAAGKTKIILLHNGSSGALTLKHQAGAEAAANRFKLPLGKDITVLADASVELFYSSVETCWKLKSGSGSGGGGGAYAVVAAQTILNAGTIPTTLTDIRQFIPVVGNGVVQTNNAPFGTAGGWADGAEFFLVGTDDANTVTINFTDAAYGVVGNKDSVTLGRYDNQKLVWSAALSRFIAQN